MFPHGFRPLPGVAGVYVWDPQPPSRSRWARPPSHLLTRALAGTDPGPDNHDRLERVAAWEGVIAWAQAQQLREVAEFVDTAAAAPPPPCTAEEAVESAEAELALILHTTTRAAADRADEARQLCHRFPATLAALHAGAITLGKARILLDGLGPLDNPAEAEEKLLGRADRQTPGQLREAVRRAVLRADPAAARRRHEKARRERRVVLYPERDGMATVAALLPAVEAVGVWAVLDQHARACPATGSGGSGGGSGGDGRSMDARRADTLVDLVLGETGFASTGTTEAAGTTGTAPAEAVPDDGAPDEAAPDADAPATRAGDGPPLGCSAGGPPDSNRDSDRDDDRDSDRDDDRDTDRDDDRARPNTPAAPAAATAGHPGAALAPAGPAAGGYPGQAADAAAGTADRAAWGRWLTRNHTAGRDPASLQAEDDLLFSGSSAPKQSELNSTPVRSSTNPVVIGLS